MKKNLKASRSKNRYRGNIKFRYRDSPSFLLPTPAMIESYEEISPGFAARLMELVVREQDVNHQNLLKHTKWLNINKTFNYLFMIIFTLFVLVLSFRLLIIGYKFESLLMFFIYSIYIMLSGFILKKVDH